MERQITAMIRRVVPDRTAHLTTDMNLIDDLGMDSVGLLEVIAALEDEFGIVLEDSDLELGNFRSIEAICSMVRRHELNS